MNESDGVMRKLKHEWKKDKAVLEQQNQLLKLNLLDMRDRELNLKRSNQTLLQAIDTNRSSRLMQAQMKLNRLEEENSLLRERLVETSKERDVLAQKKKHLKAENNCFKMKMSLHVREKKVSQKQHKNQLDHLQVEFEKLRQSNDRLLEAFKQNIQWARNSSQEKNTVIQRKEKESCRSSVVICSMCAEGRDICPECEDGRQPRVHSRDSESRSSKRETERTSQETNIKFQPTVFKKGEMGANNNFRRSVGAHPFCRTESNLLSNEIRRSMKETDRQRSSYFNTFVVPASSNDNSKREEQEIRTQKSSAVKARGSITKQSNVRSSISRTLTECGVGGLGNRGFMHKRKGAFGHTNLPLAGCSRLNYNVSTEYNEPKEPLFHQDHLEKTGSVSRQLDQSQKKPLQSSSLNVITSEVDHSEYGNKPGFSKFKNRVDTVQDNIPTSPSYIPETERDSKGLKTVDLNSYAMPCRKSQQKETKVLFRKGGSMANLRMSIPSIKELNTEGSWLHEQENNSTLGRPTAASVNKFASSSGMTRESIDECLSFNEMLRAKLENIEGKLKGRLVN